MKTCTKCGTAKDVSEYWRHPNGAGGLTPSCKECHRLAAAVWRQRNPDKAKAKAERKKIHSRNESYETKRDRQLRSKYGVSISEWKSMFDSQKGCCAICDRHQSSLTRVLQLDHCHKSGDPRGLLCAKCNTKLAAIEEDGFMDRALVYLNRSRIRLVAK